MNLLAQILAAVFLLTNAALSQETTPKLSPELNALQQAQSGCRISFVAFNGLGARLDRAAFEVALFDKAGAIDRLVTLDFKDMPGGKTKILRFELQQLDCADVGRVLINDVRACEGAEVAADACLARLETETRLNVTFGI